MTLTNQYSWSQLCDRTIAKVAEGLSSREHKKFRAWFMRREKLGYLFDPLMILRCYRVCQELEQGLDHFFVIDGREGTGKSTIAHQIAAWIYSDLTLKYTCTTAKAFLEILHERAHKFKREPDHAVSVIFDEGTELLSRDTLQVTNKVLVKTFFVQRALRLCVIINIPNFHLLDSVVRHHRVRTLVHITARGKYTCYTGKAIKRIARDGQRTKTVTGIPCPDGTFWQGYFNKDFPHTIDRKEYEEKKHDDIRKFIETMQDDIISRKMYPAAQTAKEIGCTTHHMVNMVKSGEVEGKQIGSKWFITRRAYDKLLSVPYIAPTEDGNPKENQEATAVTSMT